MFACKRQVTRYTWQEGTKFTSAQEKMQDYDIIKLNADFIRKKSFTPQSFAHLTIHCHRCLHISKSFTKSHTSTFQQQQNSKSCPQVFDKLVKVHLCYTLVSFNNL